MWEGSSPADCCSTANTRSIKPTISAPSICASRPKPRNRPAPACATPAADKPSCSPWPAPQTYWRIPVYYGGFIALATVIDYNNRNYQRYKTAYNALTDGNPSTVDEFNGRYSAELLADVRNAYRRDRDLAIIGMAAAYLLSVIDTYVIASLKNWDVDEDLTVRVQPTMIDTRFNGRTVSPSQGSSYGLALKVRF